MCDYQRISLDDYFRSGEGGEGVSYTRKDGKTMAKLFLRSMGAETTRREFFTACAVYKAGIPSPKPIRLVTDGERFGAEYELIKNKRSYTRIISQEPGQLEPLTLKFARLARELHSAPADTTVFPEMNALVRGWLERSSCLTDELRARLLGILDTLPSPKTCLHGDLHIGNIITDGTADYWIDLGNFAWGCPEWDFSMIYFISHYVTPDKTDMLFHLSPDVLRAHWSLLVKDYYGFETDSQVKEYEKGLMKFVALKLIYNVCKRNDGGGEPSPRLEAMTNALISGATSDDAF